MLNFIFELPVINNRRGPVASHAKGEMIPANDIFLDIISKRI